VHIAIAPFRLKGGVPEDVMVSASDDFERDFVRTQDGILRRVLVKDGRGGFADVVFFASEAAMARVMQAEQDCEAFAALLAITDGEEPPSIYEVIKTYE
jgi:hypothetical protein